MSLGRGLVEFTLLLWSLVATVLHSAYDIHIYGNEYSVTLADSSGNYPSDTSVGSAQSATAVTAPCSSLSEKGSVHCPQLTNRPFYGEIVAFLDNGYMAPTFSQPAFVPLMPKHKKKVDNMRHFRQTDDEFTTNILKIPIRFAEIQEKALDKAEKQRKKNWKKSANDPDILLKYNQQQKKSGKKARSTTSIFDRFNTHYATVNANKNIPNTNTQTGNNAESVETSVKTYTMDSKGRIMQDIRTNGDDTGTDDISTILDSAVTQLVTNMLNNENNGDGSEGGNVIQIYTDGTMSDPEQLAEELRKLVNSQMSATGSGEDGDDVEYELEFEIVYDSDNTVVETSGHSGGIATSNEESEE